MMTEESNCGGPSVWAAANPVHSSMKSDWTNSWALCQSFITLLYQQPPLPVLLEALKTMHISKAKSEGFLFVRLSVLCFEEALEVKRGNVLWLLFHCIWMKKKERRRKEQFVICIEVHVVERAVDFWTVVQAWRHKNDLGLNTWILFPLSRECIQVERTCLAWEALILYLEGDQRKFKILSLWL